MRRHLRRMATVLLAALAASALPAVRATAATDIDNDERSSVVSAYRDWLAPTQTVPVGFTGNVERCRPGTTSSANQRATLSAVNYMREMAGLPAVRLSDDLSRKSQAAALIMAANNFLAHDVPPGSRCYSRAGADGAAHGNLSLTWGGGEGLASTTGPRAVVGYVADPGPTNRLVGHRRWLLFQQLAVIGTGDTDVSNSIYVVTDRRQPAPPAWVPWPTAGFFPRELEPSGRWSLTYPGADFHRARVSVRTPQGGIRARKSKVVDGYGDNTLSWDVRLPGAYRDDPRADYRVSVVVRGIRMPGGATVTRRWTTVLVPAG